LRDDLRLATPPAHPSEAAIPNPNPLATTPAAPTAGVKLSLTTVGSRKVVPQIYSLLSRTSEKMNFSTIKESEKESRTSQETGSDSAASQTHSNGISGKAPAFGASNSLLAPVPAKDPLKRRKPKTNIVKSNSSFISRVIPHEAISKRLQERNSDGLFAFANVNRAFEWLDLGTSTHHKVRADNGKVGCLGKLTTPSKAEPLTKILFAKAHILCHDVNILTKSLSHIDVIVGSSAADIVWYEPYSQKYARINKNVSVFQQDYFTVTKKQGHDQCDTRFRHSVDTWIGKLIFGFSPRWHFDCL